MATRRARVWSSRLPAARRANHRAGEAGPRARRWAQRERL